MSDPTYPDYLQLRTGQAPPPDPHEKGVRVYADTDGALRSLQSDGTDAAIGGGGGAVLFATRTLTNDEVLSLPSTGVQIVEAPGAGKVLIPVLGLLSLSWTADYTNIDAGAELMLGWEPHDNQCLVWLQGGGAQDVASLLAFGENGIAVGSQGQRTDGSSTYGLAGLGDPSDYDNQPLHLKAVNGSGDFTGGDPANALKVNLLYALLTL